MDKKDVFDIALTAVELIFKKKIAVVKLVVGLIVLIVFLLPSSEDSNAREQGKLINNHRKVSEEYEDDYISVLSISTVRTGNELNKEYEPIRSIPFLRELIIRTYVFEMQTVTTTNDKGESVTETKEVKRLVSEYTKRGEDLISFCTEKFRKNSEDELIRVRNYKDFLKFEYHLPDEDLEINGKKAVREYELIRINAFEVSFNDEDKDTWYKFLFEEAIDNVYEEGTRRLEEAGIDPEDLVFNREEYSSEGEAIVEFAKKYIGRPYLYGARLGDTTKFDCSSYVWFIYKHVKGISISRVSQDQYRNAPIKITNINDLQIGDLVFFKTTNESWKFISHVGIYIGNGKFINAKQNGGVKIDNIVDWHNKYYDGILHTYVGGARY